MLIPYNIYDLPLLLARNSKALAFPRFAISPHNLYQLLRTPVLRPQLLHTMQRNFFVMLTYYTAYFLRSTIAVCVMRIVKKAYYDRNYGYATLTFFGPYRTYVCTLIKTTNIISFRIILLLFNYNPNYVHMH